jgi:hypothetical protein
MPPALVEHAMVVAWLAFCGQQTPYDWLYWLGRFWQVRPL